MESTITSRLIGVELECVVAIIGNGDNRVVQQLLAEVLTSAGVESIARGYSHDAIRRGIKIAVEHDSSLRDESNYRSLRWSKIEVKTAPMRFRELSEVLPTTLEVIRYCGARVNSSCGFHVHHHFPEAQEDPESVRSLQHLWWRFHQVMFGLVAPSRRTNTYCCPPQLPDATRFDRCQTHAQVCDALRTASRYSGLNLINLANSDRMTVEWRLHHGTLEWEKVKAWVLTTQRWVEHAAARSCHFKPEPVPNTQAGLNSLLVTAGLKPNSRIYRKVEHDLRQSGKFLLRRWKHFNDPREFKDKAVAA